MTSVEDTSLAAILAPSVAASRRIKLALIRPPPGSAGRANRPSTAFGRRRQRLLLRQARHDDVGPGDVDVLERVVRGLDAGDVDRLDLADVAEDRVQLAGEAVQLVVGQGKPGQTRQVGDLVLERSATRRTSLVRPAAATAPGAGPLLESLRSALRETVLRVPSYLLRVQLEDRPGSLGSLAVALGSVGADILSLDVVERAAGYAVDDLVVDLPAGAMPDMLITAAEKLNGVYVDSIRPHTGLLEAHRELELIDHVAAADGKRKQAAGARRRGAQGAARRLVHGGAADRVRLGARRRQLRAPRRHRPPIAPWLPLEHAEALDGHRRLGAAGVARHGHHAGRRAAGRPPHRGRARPPGRPVFRPAEVARLGYLAGIVATIIR